MNTLRKWLNHPLVVVPPLMIALVIGWQQHTQAGLSLSIPTQNLLASAAAPSEHGLPSGWQLSQSGEASISSAATAGYVTDSASRLTVESYQNGDITLASPKASLEPNQTYLFKSYYTSDIPFTLVARFYYADGTDKLMRLDDYPTQTGSWSTASHTFDTLDTITGVQFIYKLASNGHVSVDGMYLEQKQQVHVAQEQATTQKNAIPNSALVATNIDMPDDWTPYRSGDNSAEFAVMHDDTGSYMQVNMRDFVSGEAKWQYAPQPVGPNQLYQFESSYRSDARTKVVAEYVLKDGSRRFDTIADMLPASQWTDVAYAIEIPSDAISLDVSVVLQSGGSLSTRDYSLAQVQKPGSPQWKRPLVSLTFDRGLRSAYLNAVPLLDRYGYRATFYVSPLNIETPGFMYADELTGLSEARHEIATQGYARKDLTTLSSTALEDQLRRGKEYLANAGFPISDFAPPFGKADAEVEWFARKYFATSRGLVSGINTRQNLDPYNLKVLVIGSDTSLQKLETALANTKKSNGWLILVYRSVGTAMSNNDNTMVSNDAFASQMEAIRKSDVSVQPVSAAYEEVSQQ